MASALPQETKNEYEDLLAREMLWLQAQEHNCLSVEGLESDLALSEQYAAKLYNYRFFKCVLNYHAQMEEPYVLLNIAESFQEERIWLLLHSSPQQPRFRDYENTIDPYLIHETRYNFYKSMLRNCIQENTFQSENTNEDFFTMHSTLQNEVEKNPYLKHFVSSSNNRYTINSRSEIFYFEELIHGRNYATQDALDGALYLALLPSYRGSETPPQEESDNEMHIAIPELEGEEMHILYPEHLFPEDSPIPVEVLTQEAGAAAASANQQPPAFPDNQGYQAQGEEDLFEDDEEVGPSDTF
jgi:hypothetical protein